MAVAATASRATSGVRSTKARGTALRALGALVVILTVLFFVPAVARPASVTVVPKAFLYRTVVAFVAAPGEANDVDVTWLPDPGSPRSVVVHDPSAVLSAGKECESVDLHTVRCSPTLSPSAYLIHVDVKLRDGDDRVRFARAFSGGGGTVYAYGGGGDDVLDARNAFIARLDGGGGRDRLYGATEYSLLLDGDRDRAAGEAAPGPDVFDGRAGADDMVSYRRRSAPVVVDLADNRPDGAHGEGDRFRGIESVDGGSGDDTLAGDDDANTLNGGFGRDSVIGRGGDDQFAGLDDGPWTEVPPPADPGSDITRSSAAGDLVSCGRGDDAVVGRQSADFTPMSCDAVVVRRPLPLSIGGTRARTSVDPYPALVGRALEYRFPCSYDDDWEFDAWARLRCRGSVELRTTDRRHRLLARGLLRPTSTEAREWTGLMHARLVLTALGRARMAHGVKARAQVSFHGRYVPTDGWTIVLAGRRGA